jgi:hypothetical protein
MYNKGNIFKLKVGTSTNQLFIMLLSDYSIDENNFVIIFDNIINNIIGDTTRGVNMNDFELSSISELADFIVNNNL